MELVTSVEINGNKVELSSQGHGLKIYMSKDGDMAYVVNEKNKVLFTIEADCGQNYGFISEIKKY